MQYDYKWAICLPSIEVAELMSEQFRELRTGSDLPQYRSWHTEFGCSAFTTVTTPSILLHSTGRSDTMTGQQSIFSTLSSSLRQGGRPPTLPLVRLPAWITEKSQAWPPSHPRLEMIKSTPETSIWCRQQFKIPQHNFPVTVKDSQFSSF